MEINWKKNLLGLLLLLNGLFGVVFGAFQGSREKTEENIRMEMEALEADVLGSCVRIQANGHYGSGSIWAFDENKITIVTNEHVLQYWDEDSYVTFFSGVSGSGQVTGVSKQADVGFLCINAADLSAEELSRLSVIEVSDTVPERGDWFFMADVASDIWNPVFYQGQVLEPLKYLEDFGREMIYGDSTFRAGMSGSGVFDAEGKYIGMLTGGTDQNEIAAVPAEAMMELYKADHAYSK